MITYDLLEDRRIDDVIIQVFFNSLLYKTNRFQVAVRLFSNRSQRTSNVVRTSVTHSAAPRVPLFCSYYILKKQEGIRNNCINLVLAFLNYDSNNSQSPYEKEMLLSCSNFRRESQRSKFSINICVRRRKTHTNRVVFTEITLEGFINQS